MTKRSMILIAFTICGCSKSDKHGRYALTGTVTMNGQPMSHANVFFTGENGPTEFDTGAMVSNGSFKIPKEAGLPPGRYRARVSCLKWTGVIPKEAVNPGQEGDGELKQTVPAKFSKEGVMVDVSKDKDNHFTFEIKDP